MAPEVALDDKAFPDSDVWSFAITIGQVLKYWSMTERSLTTDEWRDKLRRFGTTDYLTRNQNYGSSRSSGDGIIASMTSPTAVSSPPFSSVCWAAQDIGSFRVAAGRSLARSLPNGLKYHRTRFQARTPCGILVREMRTT